MSSSHTSETTPLLVSPPTAVDTSPEAQIDEIPEASPLSSLRITISAAGLAFLIFLQATNISLLTVTTTDIADDLDAHLFTSWFSSAYLIAMSALGPLNGKLAAIFSPRICIFASSIFLALGTLISGSASNFAGFTIGRIITGIGASGIFTVSIILVLELASTKHRGLAIGMLNTGYTIGVASGAVAAGALLPLIGWRWIFIIQTPVALIGGLSLFLSIPSDFDMGREKSTKTTAQQLARLDWLGAITLTATIVLFLYALSYPTGILWEPLIVSPILLAVFIWIELSFAVDPIIPITLLKSRGLCLTCLGTVGYMTARWTVLFYTPMYANSLRTQSGALAAAILVPTNGGFALGGILVGWLHIRRHGSFYIPTLIVYAIFPITLVWLSTLVTHDSSIALFILDVLICGFVTGAALNYNLAHLLHLTPKSTHYVATSLLATFRGFSGSFGSAIGGGLFARTLYTSLVTGFAEHGLERKDLIRRLLGAPKLVQSLTGIEKEVAVAGYEAAFRTLFLAGAALSAFTVLIQAGTGWTAAPEEVKLDEGEEAQDDTIPA